MVILLTLGQPQPCKVKICAILGFRNRQETVESDDQRVRPLEVYTNNLSFKTNSKPLEEVSNSTGTQRTGVLRGSRWGNSLEVCWIMMLVGRPHEVLIIADRKKAQFSLSREVSQHQKGNKAKREEANCHSSGLVTFTNVRAISVVYVVCQAGFQLTWTMQTSL